MAEQKLSPQGSRTKIEVRHKAGSAKRAAIYTRISTGEQHVETQLYDLRELAKQRRYEIVHEYTDTISGAKSKRPGLDQLLADARRHRFDVVLVAAFDRVATARGWQSYLAKWLNPFIGDVSLLDVKNGVLKSIVEKLGTAGLSPKSVRNIVQVVTMVKSSAVDEDGNEIYPYKWNFEFAQVPTVENQRTPTFTGEEITKLVAKADGPRRIALTLLAASGLRAGELFGLEVKHFAGNTLSVEQSVWEGRKQAPKTKNARREIDLHPSVATLLRGFIGHRKDGFIFRSEEGTPIHQSNFLRRYLHPLLEQLGIEKQGFHGFRRFRVTHLESSTVPPALVKYWTGHASSSDGEAVRSTVTDRYVKMAKDTKFRAEVAERIGVGFELPKAETVEVVPSVPNSQESEVIVSV